MLKVAFFSPMPPARSGIADYSAALVDELRHVADVQLFDRAPAAFNAASFDVILYQLGNNADHAFVYEMALRHPGVVVMHEANLHHLIADITIRRGDWDAYVAAAEHDAGPENALAARAFAERVRALEIGPDYDGVPMLRRIVESSRGVIAHSDYVLSRVRAAGFNGPAAIIPHGAWVGAPPSLNGYVNDRNALRFRLGIAGHDEHAPLIGIFGYLKPYKRIGETLRAMRRLVRMEPRAKLILGGEPHPDFPIRQIIRTLDLDAHVRLLGYMPVEDFSAYIAACDIIVNLRYPTVGESSGSLLRAFSAGRAALVSDIGSFAELPDDICLKVPVGPGEEELIFEYLNMLVARPALTREIGARARAWVERECSWRMVARKYEAFLGAVVRGETMEVTSRPAVIEADAPAHVIVEPEYVGSWADGAAAREYFDIHSARLIRTLEITPPGDPSQSVLEMGSYMQITPALHFKLGYGTVRGCYYGALGRTDRKHATTGAGASFECLIDHFDAEKDIYPYADGAFDTVLCCELIEHLFSDPMHMMSEVNRILKPGGHFILTTPNITSYRAIAAILGGYHPGFFTSYIKPNPSGETDARHNREYTPHEVETLLTISGFEVTLLDTGPFRDEPHPEFNWVRVTLERLWLQTQLRGDGIYVVGRKTGPVRERWPAWLYA